MNHIWVYGGRELPFDVSESECMERISDALATLRNRIDALGRENASASANIREQCEIIRSFFDTVFGGGYGEEVCGHEMSAEAHLMAYMEFIAFVDAQVKAFRSRMEAVEEKYLSRANSYGECV